MNEFADNLWAPWRMEYIQSLAEETESSETGCFLCDYRNSPDADAANHVIWRTDTMLVVMNRFPYTNGHLLVAPLGHKADLADLTECEIQGFWQQIRDAKQMLAKEIKPQGFNIGINLGKCAGAGLPGHLHAHIVPRWNGDTNFMAVLGDVRVLPISLQRQHERLVEVAAEMGFPLPSQKAGQ